MFGVSSGPAQRAHEHCPPLRAGIGVQAGDRLPGAGQVETEFERVPDLVGQPVHVARRGRAHRMDQLARGVAVLTARMSAACCSGESSTPAAACWAVPPAARLPLENWVLHPCRVLLSKTSTCRPSARGPQRGHHAGCSGPDDDDVGVGRHEPGCVGCAPEVTGPGRVEGLARAGSRRRTRAAPGTGPDVRCIRARTSHRARPTASESITGTSSTRETPWSARNTFNGPSPGTITRAPWAIAVRAAAVNASSSGRRVGIGRDDVAEPAPDRHDRSDEFAEPVVAHVPAQLGLQGVDEVDDADGRGQRRGEGDRGVAERDHGDVDERSDLLEPGVRDRGDEERVVALALRLQGGGDELLLVQAGEVV